jgi:hypothetical protein
MRPEAYLREYVLAEPDRRSLPSASTRESPAELH